MSNISISDSQNYAIQQAQTNAVGKVSEGNNLRPLTTETVQEFIEFPKKFGMTTILQGQSVMNNLDTRPALLSPPVGQEKFNAEQTAELMKITAMRGGDVQRLERAVASASAAFSAQLNQSQTTSGSTNINKAESVASSSTTSATHPVHSQKPVEGGTDITATDAPGGRFINVMGDLKMLEISNLLNVTLTKQEAESAKSSAMASLRAVDAAERAGNKGIAAEKQRMTGAITSGSMGLIGQGVTTTRTVKALKTESKSIGNNLASAIKTDIKHGGNKSSISAATDNMLHKGKVLDETISGKMGSSNASVAGFGETKRNDHSQVQLKTNQVRSTTDYSNNAIHSSQKVVDGAFNVEAADETKQAELARADQAVNNDVANAHQQVAKKAADSKAALSQALEAMMSNNNSAVSSIADRIR